MKRVLSNGWLKAPRSSGRWLRRRVGVLAALGLIAAGVLSSAIAKPDPQRMGVRRVTVSAEALNGFDRVDFGRRRFGQLEWIGGLRLTSDSPAFGGWSGLALDPDGRGFLAVSDAGTWLKGALRYQGDRAYGVDQALIGPLLALNGQPLRRERDRDAEAVTLVSGTTSRGQLLIAFEQNHRIGRFKAGKNGPSRPSSYVQPRRPGARMKSLKGFEAATVLKSGPYAGSLVAIAERRHDAKGRHTGWIWVRGRPRVFSIIDIGGHDVTDVAALPDGGLLLLERRFRWLEGIRFRIRHVAAKDVRPGAEVTGEVLLESDFSQVIDNMEALAIHHDGRGGFILTLMSDDNFNKLLQQTLLLQFRWRPSSARASR